MLQFAGFDAWSCVADAPPPLTGLAGRQRNAWQAKPAGPQAPSRTGPALTARQPAPSSASGPGTSPDGLQRTKSLPHMEHMALASPVIRPPGSQAGSDASSVPLSARRASEPGGNAVPVGGFANTKSWVIFCRFDWLQCSLVTVLQADSWRCETCLPLKLDSVLFA